VAVTISLGLLLLIIVLLAWKMKGAQLPHVFLGMILLKAATPGSIIDTIAVEGLDLVNQMVNAVSGALGNGNVV
jgi:hypothetical protein